MYQMYFDFRDIFKTPRFALSLQKIWIQFVGLLLAFFGYLILTYISLLTAGISLSVAWNKYGLLPCLVGESAKWYSFIVFGIGVAWLVVAYMVTATAVSRATYMIAKGNNFYTWKEAFSFSIKKASSLVMAPVSIVIIIGLFVLGIAVVGWLGKIPYIGEFGTTIFIPLWFLAALVTVFLAVVAGVALLLTPAIIATTDDDAFEAIFQSFSTIWSQPWRLILYEAFSSFLAIAAFFIFALLAKKAFILMDRLFAGTMGADYMNISAQGMYLLSVWVAHSIGWIESLFCDYSGLIYFSREFDPLMLPGYQIVASYIFSIWMLLIGGFVASYGAASFNVGNTLSYLIIRKKKDDENLLERKDREEEEAEDSEEMEAENKTQNKAE